MTLYESNLNHYAKAILRIVGFEERDKTMDNIIQVYYRPAKDEIFLARWPQEEDAILIKAYDRSIRNWTDREVAHNLVMSLRNAGVRVELIQEAKR